MRIVDLSLTLEPSAAEPIPVQVEYISHEAGADILGKPVGIGRRDFPDGLGLSLELIRLTSHSGTHVDAPRHYGPLCEGKPARTIEELPLEWFFKPGVVLECLGNVDDGPVTVAEIDHALTRACHQLQAGDIVLVHTGADTLWPRRDYFTSFRGISRDATAFLVEAGIKVIGVDSFGFDPPFGAMLKKFQDGGGAAVLWPAHVYGREREYCQIERLTNLRMLSAPTGFMVACFPVKVAGAGAGWSRVVAIYDH